MGKWKFLAIGLIIGSSAVARAELFFSIGSGTNGTQVGQIFHTSDVGNPSVEDPFVGMDDGNKGVELAMGQTVLGNETMLASVAVTNPTQISYSPGPNPFDNPTRNWQMFMLPQDTYYAKIEFADLYGDGTDELVALTRNNLLPNIIELNFYELTMDNGPVLLGTQRIYDDILGTGNVDLAAGDMDGDGSEEVAISNSAGVRPYVALYGYDFPFGVSWMSGFRPFANTETSGTSVACGDMNADGREDLVCGNLSGEGYVRWFNGSTRTLIDGFKAFPGGTTGVRVECGDFDGNGLGEVFCVPNVGGTENLSWIDPRRRVSLWNTPLENEPTSTGINASVWRNIDAIQAICQVPGTGLLRIVGFTSGNSVERRSQVTLSHRLPGSTIVIGDADGSGDGFGDIWTMHTETRSVKILKMCPRGSLGFQSMGFSVNSGETPVAVVSQGQNGQPGVISFNPVSRAIRIKGMDRSVDPVVQYQAHLDTATPGFVPVDAASSANQGSYYVMLFNSTTRDLRLLTTGGTNVLLSEKANPGWTPIKVFPGGDNSFTLVLRNNSTGLLVGWPFTPDTGTVQNGSFVYITGCPASELNLLKFAFVAYGIGN